MSDLMALGAIRALNDHGLRVPQDISVSGYDGIAVSYTHLDVYKRQVWGQARTVPPLHRRPAGRSTCW